MDADRTTARKGFRSRRSTADGLRGKLKLLSLRAFSAVHRSSLRNKKRKAIVKEPCSDQVCLVGRDCPRIDQSPGAVALSHNPSIVHTLLDCGDKECDLVLQ